MRTLITTTVATAGVALATAGSALAEPSPLQLPSSAAPSAHASHVVYWFAFFASIAVLALVVVGMGGALARAARRQEAAVEGDPPARTSAVLLLGIVPLAAVIVVAALSFAKLADVRNAPAAGAAGTLAVKAEVSNKGWSYTYANGAVAAGTLRVPVGAIVRLTITSSDVQHSWWVPQLAGQVRVFPGLARTVAFRADRAGTFPGSSTVFPGPAAGALDTTVTALSRAEFDAWLAAAPNDKGGA